MTSFDLNGTTATADDDHPHLLAALRDELGIISPKDGCAPSGQCGSCTVLVDGKARVACQTPMGRVAGTTVLTLEGFDAAERDLYATAFAAHGALQCGFCIPGILVRTKALIDRKGAELTREEASRHLGAHLCRCTGYIKILDAVESLAAGEVPVTQPRGGVGSSGARYEAFDLSLGDRPFIDDMAPPGLLHGMVRLADHARADVLAIDASVAEALDGVERILTAADVPGDLRVGLIHQDWPVFIPVGGRTSYLGDVLALVLATDRETARRAASLIDIEYSPLEPFSDPVIAMDADEDAVWGLDGNVLSVSSYSRGDVEPALTDSTHVVDVVFQTQRIEHAFLEPESTLAVPTEGGLHVYSGGQGVWDDRNQIARVLDLDPSLITVELVSNGGAFGGKEDMSNQAQTALAAWLTGRPVRCTLTREESLLLHAKRHPIRMAYRAGCDSNGRLTALWARMLGDSGPYASVGMKVLERSAGHASGPYVVPVIDVESTAVRTNNPIGGAFRGFGANQAQFAMEGIMDRLAERVGISGWEI
ncbi:MAG: molybdopterin cofactor-binding domain-containing protein, partial [Actinomycetota bacterium]|nr:molybdopterin cofactor-binding domain-containing protein [Actinomycetota bacterium]